MSTVLTRDERATILHRCLTNWLLVKRCYRYRVLLDLPVQDLLDELGVKIYQGLFYYRFKARLTVPDVAPEEQAYKLAITVGHNALTSMVRDALKKGHINLQPIDFYAQDKAAGRWAGLSGDGSAVAASHVIDLMVATATAMAGDHASQLLRALVYDWSPGGRLTVQQAEIMRALACHNRLRVRRLLDLFRDRVRSQLDPTAPVVTKSEGVWRASNQIVG